MKIRLKDLADDVAFVRRVIGNEKSSVEYFLTVFSKPLLEYIGRRILRLPPAEVYNPDGSALREYSYGIGCSSLYYKFIAEEFPADKLFAPQWDRLRYFEANGHSRLATYLAVITTRYFYRHHPDTFDDTGAEERRREGRRGGGDESLLRSYDESERLYLLLCMRLQDQDDEVRFTDDMLRELELARSMLREKYARVVDYCFFSGLPTMEVAARMRDEFERAPESMSRKDVQTRISQWKNRAVASLANIIMQDKNRHLFTHIRDYVSKL